MRITPPVAAAAALLGGILLVASCSTSGGGLTIVGCKRSDGTCGLASSPADGGATSADAGACVVCTTDVSGDGEGPTDVGCGGRNGPKCAEGKKCLVDADCNGACNYDHRCVDVPSCKPHLGGDTCGAGEVGSPSATHESCCRTLQVRGYVDPAHPGKTVYLDKYEITAGRVRAFLADITAKNGGRPDVRSFVAAHPPANWDPAWNKFLPNDFEGDTVHVDRRLLGDRRGQPDEPPIPPVDQDQKTGLNYQFNGQLFVYLHGNNCATSVGSYGWPTWYYPPEVLAKTGPAQFPPRADGKTPGGDPVPASEHLDTKSMNCITNALLAAFCAWDGGQLATDAVLDYVTASPPELGDMPGCGTQIGTENPPKTDASQKGGRCPNLPILNATYDAGGQLPVPNFPLNTNNYHYPFFPDGTTHDKAWQVAAPGRGSSAAGAGGDPVDRIRIDAGDEPWVDLAGNLSEAVLKTSNGTFTGKFGLKYRGLGYQSARSELNMRADWEGEGGLRRIERPEARAAFAGGRCMRFR